MRDRAILKGGLLKINKDCYPTTAMTSIVVNRHFICRATFEAAGSSHKMTSRLKHKLELEQVNLKSAYLNESYVQASLKLSDLAT